MYDINSSLISIGVGSREQWIAAISPHGAADVERIVDAYIRYGAQVGMNHDLALAQACLESTYFTDWRWTDHPGWNPAGLGATSRQDPGNVFTSMEAGITAQYAHQCAYAHTAGDCPIEQLNDGNLFNDPRHALVGHRGQPNIGSLNGHWAVPGTSYAQNICAIANVVVGNAQPSSQQGKNMGINIIDIRSELTTNPNGGPRTKQSPKRGIVIHYNGPALSTERRTGKQQYINDSYYHAFQEDWGNGARGDGIMYHFGIEYNGETYQMRDFDDVLWHDNSWDPTMGNGAAWAISVQMGEGQNATPQQLDSLYDLVETLRNWASIPVENVKGHQEVSQTSCPGTLMDDFVRPYRAGTFVRPGTVPVPAPTPIPDPNLNNNYTDFNNRLVEVARGAVGQTQMGAGMYLDDQNGYVHDMADWCEAAQETIAFMVTGERIRFANAWVHRESLRASGELQMDENPPAGHFVFYGPYSTGQGHIALSTGQGTTLGTTVSPNGFAELPIGQYPNYAGHAEPEAVLRAARNLPPANPMDPMGILSTDGQYRYFGISGGYTIGGGIKAYWEGNPVNVAQALWKFGYPLSNEVTESREDGTTVVCTHTERSRLEWHPEANMVMEGQIGTEMLLYYDRIGVLAGDPLYAGIPQGDARVNMPIDPRIQAFYDKYGGLGHWGYALTPVMKHPVDGMDLQWFERGAIEIHQDGKIYGRRLGAEFLEERKKRQDAGEITVPFVS